MPLNNYRISYTPEQYAAAKANNSALDYARRTGYDLERRGKFYILREHDSMVFAPDGRWYWNSRGLRGHALEFLLYYEGKSFPEAVLTLAAEGPAAPSTSRAHDPVNHDIPSPEFKLPPRAKDMRRLFGYLCKVRWLSQRVVELMIRQGVLYESVSPMSGGRAAYNACFVSYAPNGQPCAAFERGLSTAAYKHEAPFGDKSHGWLLRGKEPDKVLVFEAAIDAASYLDLYWSSGCIIHSDFLALGCLSFTPVKDYLRRNPNTKQVMLCLDNDDAGQTATQRFTKVLSEFYPDIAVTTAVPPMGKDWNESLCHIRRAQIKQKLQEKKEKSE